MKSKYRCVCCECCDDKELKSGSLAAKSTSEDERRNQQECRLFLRLFDCDARHKQSATKTGIKTKTKTGSRTATNTSPNECECDNGGQISSRTPYDYVREAQASGCTIVKRTNCNKIKLKVSPKRKSSPIKRLEPLVWLLILFELLEIDQPQKPNYCDIATTTTTSRSRSIRKRRRLQLPANCFEASATSAEFATKSMLRFAAAFDLANSTSGE